MRSLGEYIDEGFYKNVGGVEKQIEKSFNAIYNNIYSRREEIENVDSYHRHKLTIELNKLFSDLPVGTEIWYKSTPTRYEGFRKERKESERVLGWKIICIFMYPGDEDIEAEGAYVSTIQLSQELFRIKSKGKSFEFKYNSDINEDINENFYKNVGGVERQIKKDFDKIYAILKSKYIYDISAAYDTSISLSKRGEIKHNLRIELNKLYSVLPVGTTIWYTIRPGRRTGFRKVGQETDRSLGWEELLEESNIIRSRSYISTVDMSKYIIIFATTNYGEDAKIEYDDSVKESFYKNVSGLDFESFTPANTKRCKDVTTKLFGDSAKTKQEDVYDELTKFSVSSFISTLLNYPRRYGFKMTYNGGPKYNYPATTVYYIGSDGKIWYIDMICNISEAGPLDERNAKLIRGSILNLVRSLDTRRNIKFIPVYVPRDGDIDSVQEL